MQFLIFALSLFATLSSALPGTLVYSRENTSVNPAAVTGTTCTDPSTYSSPPSYSVFQYLASLLPFIPLIQLDIISLIIPLMQSN